MSTLRDDEIQTSGRTEAAPDTAAETDVDADDADADSSDQADTTDDADAVDPDTGPQDTEG
jgi:hypothetical protein